MDFIKECKYHAKWMKKYDNPENLTLMQIQHNIALCYGFRNWKELIYYYSIFKDLVRKGE